jgi:hypothetical protein
MKPQSNDTYVLNEFGEIDVNYYISLAHKLRNDAIKEGSLKLTALIKQGFQAAAALFYRVTPA